MSGTGQPRSSQEELVEALGSGLLTGAIAQQGQDILHRMQKPLRLSVFGLPGTGKSTLMNLLLGAEVFPVGLPLPTLSITFAEQEQAVCTLPTGEVRTLPSADLTAVAALGPTFAHVMMPLPALRKLSMMEVVPGMVPEEQKRAVAWAAKRTDIALWCSQSCGLSDETLWNLLPDHVQDHAFLLLTKADVLAANGTLSKLLNLADDVAGEVFRQILPLQTLSALNARKPDGTVEKDALRASGGMALISAVLQEVETGRRAAEDAADIFLRQIDFDPAVVKPGPAPEPAPEPEVIAPKEAQAHQPEHVPEPEIETPQSVQPVVEPSPEIPAPAKPVTQAPLSVAARAACAQVVDQLTAEGAALAHQLDAGDIAPQAVVDVSVDTVTWLADYLNDAEVANEPAMQQTCATANDAADLVQLIKLEKGDSVALDALSVMIQLKHEIQAELAA